MQSSARRAQREGRPRRQRTLLGRLERVDEVTLCELGGEPPAKIGNLDGRWTGGPRGDGLGSVGHDGDGWWGLDDEMREQGKRDSETARARLDWSRGGRPCPFRPSSIFATITMLSPLEFS